MWVGWYIAIFAGAVGALILAMRGLGADAAKARLDIVHTIVATAAIFVGAVWIWDEFSRERTGVARLTATQNISSYAVPADQSLIDVETLLTNAGRTRIVLQGGFTRIQQVLPLTSGIDKKINPARFGAAKSDTEIQKALPTGNSGALAWPMLCKRLWNRKIALEPGENHEVNEQFLVPRKVELIRAYTFFDSPENSEFGYEISTLHSLRKEDSENGDARKEQSKAHRLLCTIERGTSDQPSPSPGG